MWKTKVSPIGWLLTTRSLASTTSQMPLSLVSVSLPLSLSLSLSHSFNKAISYTSAPFRNWIWYKRHRLHSGSAQVESVPKKPWFLSW